MGSAMQDRISEPPQKYRAFLYLLPAVAWFAGICVTGSVLFGEAVLSAHSELLIDRYLDGMFFLVGPSEYAVLVALFIYAVAFAAALVCVLHLLRAAWRPRRLSSHLSVYVFGLLGLSQLLLSATEAWSYSAMIGSVPHYTFGFLGDVSFASLLIIQAALSACVCLSLYFAFKQINLSSTEAG